MTIPFTSRRCRRMAFATQLYAAHAAATLGAQWFKCDRCGLYRLGRRSLLRRSA